MTIEVGVGIFVALFGGGGLVALFRLKSDNSLTIVSAAQGAVVVQSGVIDDLQEGQAALKGEVAALRAQAEVDREYRSTLEERAQDAERRADNAERQRDAVLRANADLRDRLDHLEDVVSKLGGHPDR